MIDGCKEYFRRARKNGWNVYPYVEKETLNCNLEQNFQPINLELVTYIYVYIHIAICVYINDIQLLYKHIRNIIYIAVFYVISTLQTDTGLRVFTCDHRLSRRESALKFRDCVSERDIIYIYIYIKRKKKYIYRQRERERYRKRERKREKNTLYTLVVDVYISLQFIRLESIQRIVSCQAIQRRPNRIIKYYVCLFNLKRQDQSRDSNNPILEKASLVDCAIDYYWPNIGEIDVGAQTTQTWPIKSVYISDSSQHQVPISQIPILLLREHEFFGVFFSDSLGSRPFIRR